MCKVATKAPRHEGAQRREGKKSIYQIGNKQNLTLLSALAPLRQKTLLSRAIQVQVSDTTMLNGELMSTTKIFFLLHLFPLLKSKKNPSDFAEGSQLNTIYKTQLIPVYQPV
jgi:hypothetical protein